MIEFSGVRSSCDIVARKADFRRSADSAFSLAIASSAVRSRTRSSRWSRYCLSSSSERCRWVTSMAMPRAARETPSGSGSATFVVGGLARAVRVLDRLLDGEAILPAVDDRPVGLEPGASLRVVSAERGLGLPEELRDGRPVGFGDRFVREEEPPLPVLHEDHVRDEVDDPAEPLLGRHESRAGHRVRGLLRLDHPDHLVERPGERGDLVPAIDGRPKGGVAALGDPPDGPRELPRLVRKRSAGAAR